MGPSTWIHLFLPGQSVESIFNLSNSTDAQPGKSVPSRWIHLFLPGQMVPVVESIFNMSNSTNRKPGKSVPSRWIHPSRWTHVNAPLLFRICFQQASVTKNVETVQLLLSAGAQVSHLDNGGKTPLTSIIWDHVRAYPNTGTIHEDVWTIIDLLIKAGTDLDNCSRENSNALVMATSFKCAPLVKYLLENGASMKLKCRFHFSYLHIAGVRHVRFKSKPWAKI